MSRRITFISVETINSHEAIQPGQDDREESLQKTVTVKIETQEDNDHQKTTINVSLRKEAVEVLRGSSTISSKVDHQVTFTTDEYLPHNTAIEEVIAGGGVVTQPNKSAHRLRKLIRRIWQRIKLLLKPSLQEFLKEVGKEAVKALKWLFFAISLLFHC